MSLARLPLELLLEIVGYLPERDIITLALRVLNKTIHAACLPRFQPIAATRKHEKAMISRFMHYRESWPKVSEKRYKEAGMDKKYGPWVANDNPDATFLEPFNGSLDWLPQPQKGDPGHGEQEMKAYEKDVDDAKRLIQQATELGARIPPGFAKLMTTPALGWKIVRDGGDYFELDQRLRKILPSTSPDEDAYVFRFLCDQQGVDTGRCICEQDRRKNILSSSELDASWGDPDEDSYSDYDDKERKELEGVSAEGKATPTLLDGRAIQLLSVNFEEWLCNYFITLQVRYDDNKLDPVVEEYFRRNFSSSPV